nr:M14 metal carboxypeptidase 2 [Antheraea pernyi]
MKSFENYKVYNVVPKSESQVHMLNNLRKQGYDFWTDVLTVGSDARIMVAPAQDGVFVEYTKAIGVNANITINNVQELIDAQLRPAKGIDRSTTLGSYSWDRYHNLQHIHAWLDELTTLYPGIVTTMVIGTSHEGRELKGIVIDFKAGDRGENPLVAMIEGGIHAREWISPATVTWIIKEFLTSDDPDVRFLAETFIWHIIPVTNPDGYYYTFDGDRMWRKNRNPANYVVCNSGDTDLGNGIDLNRNFDFLWMTTGASDQPCSQTYAGPIPSSEREAQAIMNYVLRLKQTGNFIYYFAFHSYSQMDVTFVSLFGSANVVPSLKNPQIIHQNLPHESLYQLVKTAKCVFLSLSRTDRQTRETSFYTTCMCMQRVRIIENSVYFSVVKQLYNLVEVTSCKNFGNEKNNNKKDYRKIQFLNNKTVSARTKSWVATSNQIFSLELPPYFNKRKIVYTRYAVEVKHKRKRLCLTVLQYPMRHTHSAHSVYPHHFSSHKRVADQNFKALKSEVSLQKFNLKNFKILDEVSGSSFDWVKGVAEIPIVYLFELRDVGEYGFLLPPEQIIPNNEEITDCLIEMDKATRNLRYYSGTVPVYSSIISLITSVVFLMLMK